MSKDRGIISEAEYARLSDQKADDWRAISEVTPTLFGVAGALFAAGVADENSWILAISPLPLFLGLFHMIRNAKLQLQMITFLATHKPPSGAKWERDVAEIRPGVYEALGTRALTRLRRKDAAAADPDRSRTSRAIAWAVLPSSWNTWLVIAVATGILVNLVAVAAGYSSSVIAAGVGCSLVLAAASLLASQARTIERDRHIWTAAWQGHIDDGDPDTAAEPAQHRT